MRIKSKLMHCDDQRISNCNNNNCYFFDDYQLSSHTSTNPRNLEFPVTNHSIYLPATSDNNITNNVTKSLSAQKYKNRTKIIPDIMSSTRVVFILFLVLLSLVSAEETVKQQEQQEKQQTSSKLNADTVQTTTKQKEDEQHSNTNTNTNTDNNNLSTSHQQEQQQHKTEPLNTQKHQLKYTQQQKQQHDQLLAEGQRQLDAFQRQIFERNISPFASLMQGFFPNSLTSAFSQQPKVSFAKTDDKKYLIVKLKLAKTSDESIHGAKRNIAYALTSSTSLQVRVEVESDGSTMTTSNEFSLPEHVTGDDMSTIPASDGSIYIKMRILNEKEIDQTSHNQQQQQQQQQQQESTTVKEENQNDKVGSVKIPEIDEILDAVLGGRNVNDRNNNDFASPLRPAVPLIIRFRPFGVPPSSVSRLRFRLNNNDMDTDGSRPQELNALFEELPSGAHTARCYDRHREDKIQLRKCLCDVTPMATRASCYSRFVAHSIRTARHIDGLNEFASMTKKSAYDCVNDTQKQVEDGTQCMERVASKVVSFLSNDNGEQQAQQQQLRNEMRKALEAEDIVTSSNFQNTPTQSTGLMIIEIIFGATVLSVVFWSGIGYALRRGYFGNRTGGLLSHLSSVLTQRSSTFSSSTIMNRKEGANGLPVNIDAKQLAARAKGTQKVS